MSKKIFETREIKVTKTTSAVPGKNINSKSNLLPH